MMRNISRLFLLLIGLSCFHTAMAKQPAPELKVALINMDRPPYFWQPTSHEPARGFYLELLEAIGQRAGINFTYHFLPQARVRLYMKRGRMDLEPGIDREWRQQPGEAEATVYSVPFLDSEEVHVFNQQRFNQVPPAFEIERLKICTLIGFNLLDGTSPQSSEIDSSSLISEQQILQMLSKQRCDYALFPRDVLESLADSLDFPMLLSPPVARYQLRLRIARKHESLLPAINKAIKELQQSGQINHMLTRYQNAQ